MRSKFTEFAVGRDEFSLPYLAQEIHRSGSSLLPLIEIPANSAMSAIPVDLPTICFTRDPKDSALASSPADVVIPDHLFDSFVNIVQANPQAALVLTQLLRATEAAPIPEALTMESMAYSLLQNGSEFARWLAGRPEPRMQTDEEPTIVCTDSSSGALRITLNRPRAANSLTAQMRSELFGVLQAAAVQDGPVELSATGRHFSAGGDLNEFGFAIDPLLAHAQRLSQNIPGSVAALSSRLTANVHGACIGAGMELSSFASRIIAKRETVWKLPEVSMGLLPGCGGTVSIPRRIGRHRTLLMALTGMQIDADTALEWGLIDEVET